MPASPSAPLPESSAPLVFDTANPVHARALERLGTEEVAWLGTIDRHGFPHAVPVWFLWEGGTIQVLIQPGSVKTRNIRRDPKVLVHFETDAEGEDVTVLQGIAELAEESSAEWMARLGEPYLAKYRAGLDRLGWSLDRMTDDYSTVLHVRPTKLIGW
ncbi:pyridoxamine 5'-phosphate oxidase family protein [Agromyces mediolanus]|uniref:pyridoxamine 5'-phosphate oxidase family protein n=1 Tax=Agromyces mediolanus TaxID=41986 RepID=UPI0038391271